MQQIDVLGIEDTDGAFAETLEEAGGRSRRRLLRDAGLAGGALAGAGMLFGGFAPTAGAASRRQDLTILQFALVAEYLGAAFYGAALEEGKLQGETLRYARAARRDEVAHVAFVQTAIRGLGGTPRPAPRFDFKGTTADQAKFRTTALMIETMCVRVLNGAGPLVTKPTLAGAARLVSVEARQVAWISLILEQNPAPSAAEAPLSLATAKRRLAATGFVPSLSS
jgi:hypothetical protein